MGMEARAIIPDPRSGVKRNVNVRPAWATYFRLCLKEKKRGKFLHTHKMETTETPGKTKATGITTQDLSRK